MTALLGNHITLDKIPPASWYVKKARAYVLKTLFSVACSRKKAF